MKKRNVLIFGLLAVVLAFVLAGCPNTGGGSSGSSDPAYSGKFTMDGTDVFFELDNTGSISASFSIVGGRSLAVAGSTSITGRLKDPSGVHRVSGTYDPASGAFEVSADGTGSRYRISGAFGSDKQVLANALVYDKSKTDSTSLAAFNVDVHSGAIGGGGAAMTGNLPNEFLGMWVFRDDQYQEHDDWPGESTATITFSPYTFYFLQTENVSRAGRGKVVRCNEASGGVLVEIRELNESDPSTYPRGYYDAIFVIPGLDHDLNTTDKNDVADAFEAYLSTKGISGATRVIPSEDNGTDWDRWTSDSTTKEYYITSDGSAYCHNFTVEQDWLNLLSRWRSATNLRSQYNKIRIWIDGAGKFNMGYYPNQEGGIEGDDTLSEAREATWSDDMDDMIVPFTRP